MECLFKKFLKEGIFCYSSAKHQFLGKSLSAVDFTFFNCFFYKSSHWDWWCNRIQTFLCLKESMTDGCLHSIGKVRKNVPIWQSVPLFCLILCFLKVLECCYWLLCFGGIFKGINHISQTNFSLIGRVNWEISSSHFCVIDGKYCVKNWRPRHCWLHDCFRQHVSFV